MLKLKINNQVLVPLFTTIYLLNPVIGLVFTINSIFSKAKIDKRKLISLLSIFLALFLSFINCTKVPENDLIHHGVHYLKAINFSYLEYLFKYGKEPVYYTFNYVFYHITDGSFKLWVLTFSFISYFVFFSAIIKYFRKLEVSNILIVFGLILGAFFPQFFSLSAHLIRQFLAGALFMYFAVDKIFYGKNKWWLALISILIHSSALLLVLLVYFKFLGNFKRYRIVNIVLLVALLSYQSLARLLLSIIGEGEGFVVYILKRASVDTNFDLGGFQLLNYIMMFTLILIGIYFLKSLKEKSINQLDNKEIGNLISRKDSFKFFLNTMVILSFFILININQSELSNRLFFYLFFYFPFIFPLFVQKFSNKGLITYFFSVLFATYFVYRLAFGVWQYAPLYKLVTMSSFSFFLYPEPDLFHVQ